MTTSNIMPVQGKSQPKDFIYAIVVVGIIGVIFYLLMLAGKNAEIKPENYSNYGSVGSPLIKTNAPQEFASAEKTAEPDNIPRSASSAISASSAVVLADMNTSAAKIRTPNLQDKASREGTVINDIKYATKGDGQIRPVIVNNKQVDPDLVKLTMFENQDFMYRLQNPTYPLPHLQDPSIGRQKSMFGKMTYPLVWEKGTLGMDVIGEKDDTRVTISFTGGRPPVEAT